MLKMQGQNILSLQPSIIAKSKVRLIAIAILMILLLASLIMWRYSFDRTGVQNILSGNIAIASSTIERIENGSRSQIGFTKGDKKIIVYLFAEDEKMEIQTGGFCGADDGTKVYSGHYHLVSMDGNSIISDVAVRSENNDPRETVFTERRLWDGIHDLYIYPVESIMTIYQSMRCGEATVELFRVDDSGKIVPVLLDNSNITSISGEVQLIDDTYPAICDYVREDQVSYCTSYKYQDGSLVKMREWMASYEEDAYKPKPQHEAMYALYKFLTSWQDYHNRNNDYHNAALYYGGPVVLDGVTITSPTQEQKEKYLASYCTAHTDTCYSIAGRGPDGGGLAEIKFDSERQGIYQFTVGEGHSGTYRVKQIVGEYKVLDLPPVSDN